MPIVGYWFDRQNIPGYASNERVCVFQVVLRDGKEGRAPLLYAEIESEILWCERRLPQVEDPLIKADLEQNLTVLRRARDKWPSEASEQKTP